MNYNYSLHQIFHISLRPYRKKQDSLEARLREVLGYLLQALTGEIGIVTAAWDVNGKGKAVADYESASSLPPANNRVSASSDKGFGKSPMPTDDDCIFATARSVLGATALVPKSILWKPTSAPTNPLLPVRPGNAFISIIYQRGTGQKGQGCGDKVIFFC